MIVEYIQILSTAWHVLNPEKSQYYYENKLLCKKTHENHPCNVWVRQHVNNYTFLVKLTWALIDEWHFRYDHNNAHALQSKLDFLTKNCPPSIPDYEIIISRLNPHGFTLPMFQAVPEDCKHKPNKLSVSACILAYRNVYVSEHKKHIAEWYIKINKQRLDILPPWWYTFLY